jgi:hypothetical protein
MALAEDLQAKRPGEWTQADIDGLKQKYNRIHFTHFSGQTSQAYRDNYDRIFRNNKTTKKREKRRKGAEVKKSDNTK